MTDIILNEATSVEITSHIIKTYRTPSLNQVVNVSLSGLVYVQNIGSVMYQVQVDFVIHESNDIVLLNAWKDGNLIKVVDDDKIYYGYIIDLTLDQDFANGYHSGSILIQEEIVE